MQVNNPEEANRLYYSQSLEIELLKTSRELFLILGEDVTSTFGFTVNTEMKRIFKKIVKYIDTNCEFSTHASQDMKNLVYEMVFNQLEIFKGDTKHNFLEDTGLFDICVNILNMYQTSNLMTEWDFNCAFKMIEPIIVSEYDEYLDEMEEYDHVDISKI